MLRLKLLVPKKALKSVSMLKLKVALRPLLKAGTGGAEADTEADSKAGGAVCFGAECLSSWGICLIFKTDNMRIM